MVEPDVIFNKMEFHITARTMRSRMGRILTMLLLFPIYYAKFMDEHDVRIYMFYQFASPLNYYNDICLLTSHQGGIVKDVSSGNIVGYVGLLQ